MVDRDLYDVRRRSDCINGTLRQSNVNIRVHIAMQSDLYPLTSLAGWEESSCSSCAASMVAVKSPARYRQHDVVVDKDVSHCLVA